MGLYDYLICAYPLPDGFDPTGVEFQTKDTPAQYLETYVLRVDGTLYGQDEQAAIPFHGLLTFYADNVAGSSADGICTSDDMPPWWAEYQCLYDHGRLLKIEGQRVMLTGWRHLTRHEWITQSRTHAQTIPSQEGHRSCI